MEWQSIVSFMDFGETATDNDRLANARTTYSPRCRYDRRASGGEALGYDSRQRHYRRPGGAARTGRPAAPFEAFFAVRHGARGRRSCSDGGGLGDRSVAGPVRLPGID